MDAKRRVTILCPLCGVVFDPSETKTNICTQCLITQENITENITDNETVQFCNHCKRYSRYPLWVLCDRESKDLLALCLKKIKGIDDLKLIDAKFLFTEPSTRTLKVQIIVQKNVMGEAAIQQTHIVEFREEVKQCPDCKKEFTPHTWVVSIQIRQRVDHKKTFLHLEQLILQNHLQDRAMRIEAVDDGLDFFYKSPQQGREMIQFLQAHLPVQIKHSTELISQDYKNNTQNIKHTYSVSVPRICKDNLVVIPQKLANILGGVGQFQVCYKVSSQILLFDPMTMRCSELSAERYYQYEIDIDVYEVKKDGIEFTVIDVEKLKPNIGVNMGQMQSQLMGKCVEVQVMKETGNEYEQYSVKCHLGGVQVGGTVLGFDLQNNSKLNEYAHKPDIVLVAIQKERQQKVKKLQRLKIENNDDNKRTNKKQSQKQELKEDQEITEYLNEIDEIQI